MDFGKRFKHYRQQAGLTQKEAAEVIGIKDYQLGNYETNRSQPSLEILIKMSKAYSISIDKMLGNNVLRNKYEKDQTDNNQDYIDVNEVLKKFTEYVDQVNKEKKKNS